MEGCQFSERKLILIAIDIEGRGPSPKRHGIVSIGICISDTINQHKHRFSMSMLPGQAFEEKCLCEFWEPRREVLKALTEEAVDPMEQMQAFRKVIDMYTDPYIVVDCPAYDITYINYYLDYFDLPLIQFDKEGRFRPIHDADSYTRGKFGMGLKEVWVDNDKASDGLSAARIPKGNHMPDADAEHILLHHLQMMWKK